MNHICPNTRVGVQVSRREFDTHIQLDYVRIEFYLVFKKKKKVTHNQKEMRERERERERERSRNTNYIGVNVFGVFEFLKNKQKKNKKKGLLSFLTMCPLLWYH